MNPYHELSLITAKDYRTTSKVLRVLGRIADEEQSRWLAWLYPVSASVILKTADMLDDIVEEKESENG